MTDLEKKYVEFKVKYPSMTDGELLAFFPSGFYQLKESNNVKRALAEIKKRELDLAAEAQREKVNIEASRLRKRESLKEIAMNNLEEALTHDDWKIKWDATKEILRSDGIRESKIAEIKAQMEMMDKQVDEPYPEV